MRVKGHEVRRISTWSRCHTSHRRVSFLHFDGGSPNFWGMTRTAEQPAGATAMRLPAAIGLRLRRSLGGVAGALIGLALVLLIFGLWQPRKFLSSLTFLNVLRYNYDLVVTSVGATFVIITAGIDLSAGSVIAFSCVTCAMAARGFD